MKIFRLSFAGKFAACILLIGIILITFSAHGHCASSTIRVMATVLPKAPQVDYKKLQSTINGKIQGYKEDEVRIQGKTIRVNVNLDCPDGEQGISIEVIEY